MTAKLIVTLVALTATATPGQAKPPRPCDTTQAEFRTYVRAVYHRTTVSRTALRKIQRDRACARSPKANRNMLAFQRAQGRARRERILIDQLTPYGRFAIPEYIVRCESNYNMRALNPSSGAGGWYQLLPSTSLAYGGTSTPHLMSAVQQHRVAGRVLRAQGLSAWVCA